MQRKLYIEIPALLHQVKEKHRLDNEYYERLIKKVSEAYEQLQSGLVGGTIAGVDEYHQHAKFFKEFFELICSNRRDVGRDILADIKKNTGL